MTEHALAATTAEGRQLSGSLLLVGTAGVIGGVLLAIVTTFAADAVSGPIRVEAFGDPLAEIALSDVILYTALGGVLAMAGALGVRRIPAGLSAFLVLSVLVLIGAGVLSLVAAETTSAGLWLNVIHLAAAGPIVAALSLWLKAKSASS
ncbi:MAG: hypothetical protein AAF531_26015 [Actinomycetota bacterium]